MRNLKLSHKIKCLELREHQNKSIDQTVRALTSGRDMLVSKPTGSGKGVEIMALAARLIPLGWRIIITAPQINILGNFLNRGEGAWTHLKSGSQIFDISGKDLIQEKLDARDIGRYLLQGEGYALAMTQQALVYYNKRLPNLDKCLLIADEFHHAAADGFGAIVSEWKRQGGLVAGYTATPWRTDGREVGWLNDNMAAYYLSLAEHMQSGHCPSTLHSEFVGYRVEEITDDNFSGKTLTKREAESIAEEVYAKWVKDKKPKFVLYYQSSTVQRNRQVREAILRNFKKAGERILDSTGEEGDLFNTELEAERKLSHKESKYAGIVGCGRVREGMDWPHCAAVYVIGMPTSTNLLVQLFGRACRKKGDDYTPAAYKDIAEISFFLPSTHENTFEEISQVHSWNTLAVCFFLTDSSLGQRSIPIRKIGSVLQKVIKDPKQKQEIEEETTRIALDDDSTYSGRSIENEVALQVVDLAEQGLYLNEIVEHLCDQGYDADTVKGVIVQQGMIEHPETGDFVEKEAKKAYQRQVKAATKISIPKIRKEVFEAYVQEFRTLTLKGSAYAKGVAKQLHQVGGVKALVDRLQEGHGRGQWDLSDTKLKVILFVEANNKYPHSGSGVIESDTLGRTWGAFSVFLRTTKYATLKGFLKSEFGEKDRGFTIEEIKRLVSIYYKTYDEFPTTKSGIIGNGYKTLWTAVSSWVKARGYDSFEDFLTKECGKKGWYSAEEMVSRIKNLTKRQYDSIRDNRSPSSAMFHGIYGKTFHEIKSGSRRLTTPSNKGEGWVSEDVLRETIQGMTCDSYNEARKSLNPGYPAITLFSSIYGKTFGEIREGYRVKTRAWADINKVSQATQGLTEDSYNEERVKLGPEFPNSIGFSRIYGKTFSQIRDGERSKKMSHIPHNRKDNVRLQAMEMAERCNGDINAAEIARAVNASHHTVWRWLKDANLIKHNPRPKENLIKERALMLGRAHEGKANTSEVAQSLNIPYMRVYKWFRKEGLL